VFEAVKRILAVPVHHVPWQTAAGAGLAISALESALELPDRLLAHPPDPQCSGWKMQQL
jgi:hypothetical protein